MLAKGTCRRRGKVGGSIGEYWKRSKNPADLLTNPARSREACAGSKSGSGSDLLRYVHVMQRLPGWLDLQRQQDHVISGNVSISTSAGLRAFAWAILYLPTGSGVQQKCLSTSDIICGW